jgi:hypothetical protein
MYEAKSTEAPLLDRVANLEEQLSYTNNTLAQVTDDYNRRVSQLEHILGTDRIPQAPPANSISGVRISGAFR